MGDSIFYVLMAIIIFVVIILYFQKRININKKAIKFDSNPDLPVEFGYKCQWFAVKTNDTQAVLDALKLKNIQISNWRTGIDGAYEGYYFISPAINGDCRPTL